jgi:hypothetical protein
MLDTAQGLSLLTLMEIVAPILLAIALAYGIIRGRQNRAEQLRSETATRNLYQQEDNREKGMSPEPPY